jgi:hypothetical protein
MGQFAGPSDSRRYLSPLRSGVIIIRDSAQKPMNKKDAFMLRALLWEDKRSPHEIAPFFNPAHRLR